nr:coat protein [Partitiviridae sp.]
MIMVTNSEEIINSLSDYVFYVPRMDFIEHFSIDLERSIRNVKTTWATLSNKQIYDILMSAIALYYHLTHRDILVYCGKEVPIPYDLKVLSTQLKVPRFVRDIAREFCRPMYFNNNIYIPELEFKEGLACYYADLFKNIKDILPTWDYAMKRLECEIVEICAEAPSPVPISFFDPYSQEIWMAKQLPEWRLEAFLYLRHLKYEYFEGIEHTFNEDASVTTSRKGRQNGDKINQNKEDQPKQEAQLFNMRKTGRKVGGFAGFIVSTVGHKQDLGYIPPDYRFATIEEEGHFSRTPPQSRRASDINGTVNSKRGRYQSNRNPHLTEAAAKLSNLTKRGKANLNKKTMLNCETLSSEKLASN